MLMKESAEHMPLFTHTGSGGKITASMTSRKSLLHMLAAGLDAGLLLRVVKTDGGEEQSRCLLN